MLNVRFLPLSDILRQMSGEGLGIGLVKINIENYDINNCRFGSNVLNMVART
jgi:hypothetical protein